MPANVDVLVKSLLKGMGWLSKKFHIQGVVIFHTRRRTCSMLSG